MLYFCKWSNLWSKHFVGVFLKRVTPEKVSVYKGFQAFEKSRSGNRLHAPKRRALPTAPHPERLKILNFWSFSVSGQICGQATLNGIFAREDSAEKVSVYKGFRRFLLRNTLGAVSCSQSRRATNCATSRNI